MPSLHRNLRAVGAALALTLIPAAVSAFQLPTPAAHFGHEMGESKKLAHWDEITEYFQTVGAASDRIIVDTVGFSTNGHPFLVLTISSPENLARLDEIRGASKEIADGRVDRARAEEIARTVPATAFINHAIHSTEVGSSQTSVQLVYDLLTGDDETTRTILDEVVTVLIPSTNPDGQIMVTEWYRRNVDTEYDGARMPWLYHHYAGHDNNRDFFQANLVETRHWMEAMYHESYPQLYLDQHQMGGRGPRIFVPPYPDPMNPDVHPLQWQQLQFIGGGMVADLQAAGKQGVVTGSMYRIWGQEGALTGRYHNIVALLTETASAQLATPDTVELEVLERGAAPGRGLGEYGFQMAFVDPWMGGEWTLEDIVEYQMISAISFLEQAARFREHYVLGRWQMASETIAKGEAEGPGAYVIPFDQADPVTAAEMVDALILQGIEVHRASEAFEAVVETNVWDTPDDGTMTIPEVPTDEDGEPIEADPRLFPAGSWVVLGAQPGRAAVLDLLEPRNRRLEREWPGGPYRLSYDGAAYTMPMQMGVETLRVSADDVGALERVTESGLVAPPLPVADRWYAMSAEGVRSWQAASRLLQAGIGVSRAQTAAGRALLVSANDPSARDALTDLSAELGITVTADPADPTDVSPQSASRIGLYQGWTASMDEGWTRLVLDRFDFPYTSLTNEDVREGRLVDNYDVVIIPSEIPITRLIEGDTNPTTPPEFSGGIGQEGVDHLKDFVRAGGTLVTFERGDAVVLAHFDIPIRDALSSIPPSELFAPASLFRVELDEDHPLTMGSPAEVAAKWARGRAYEPTGFGGEAGRIHAVGRWAEDSDRVLMSGLLHGAEHLAGKAAILDIEYGEGRVLMYGFRVQHRGQTHGTFKLLFNAFLKDDPRAATE